MARSLRPARPKLQPRRFGGRGRGRRQRRKVDEILLRNLKDCRPTILAPDTAGLSPRGDGTGKTVRSRTSEGASVAKCASARELNISGSQQGCAAHARERFRSDICRRRRRARARELKVLAPRGMARCARRNTGPLRNLRARAMPTRDDKSGRSGAARCARQKTVRPRNLRASAKRGRAENFAPAGEAHYPCRQAPRQKCAVPAADAKVSAFGSNRRVSLEWLHCRESALWSEIAHGCATSSNVGPAGGRRAQEFLQEPTFARGLETQLPRRQSGLEMMSPALARAMTPPI